MIGKMKNKIIIERQKRTDDGGGGSELKWEYGFSVFANVIPQSGRETFFADQIEHRITHKIIIRYTDEIQSKDRVAIRTTRNGRKHEKILKIIRIIDKDFKHDFLELQCEEGVDI